MLESWCTSFHNGTSASSSTVSAIIALDLEVNYTAQLLHLFTYQHLRIASPMPMAAAINALVRLVHLLPCQQDSLLTNGLW
jgi:hypothetical protein